MKSTRWYSLSRGIGILAVLLALGRPCPGVAAMLVVANTNDAGAGSFRQAIADNAALGGSKTIVFSGSVTGIIALTSQLVISTHVTILGPGPEVLAISGNHVTRVFLINSGNVSISGLTVADGKNAIQGNGIEQPSGSLTLSNCVIVNCTNAATDGGGIYSGGALSIIGCTIRNNTGYDGGGLVINGGNATILNSTICSNTATGPGPTGGGGGGGIYFANGTLSISNCTVSANACGSSGFGGGILTGIAGTLHIANSTIAANVCASGNGGGIQNNLGAAGALVISSIIAGNLALPNRIPDCGGIYSSGGYNLIGKTNGSSGWSVALQDQFGDNASPLDPRLGPLQNNGGFAPTLTLLSDSPAIDKGNSFGLTTDQRGVLRPYDFAWIANASGGDGSDIGAFELGRPLLQIQRTPGDNVVLSWPSYYDDFGLEDTDAPLAANNWETVTNLPVVIGNQFTVTNAAFGPGRLYRLRRF